MAFNFSSPIKLHRHLVFALLFAIFVVAYVLSPYWLISTKLWEQALFLIGSVLLGLTWAYLASNSIVIYFQPVHYLSLGILWAVIIILNYRALLAVIPWRGDEDYHINVVLNVWGLMKFHGLVTAVLLLLFLYEGWRKSKQILFSAVFLVGMVALLVWNNQSNFDWVLRYPHATRWLNVMPLYVIVPLFGPFEEATYRIVPFLSVILLAWFCQRELRLAGWPLGLLFGLAVATTPVIWYYSSTLYMEMPALVLMTVVCFRIKSIIRGDLSTISTQPAWYALILVGFIKETTLPFLMSFVLLRGLVQFWPPTKEKLRAARLIDESKVAFCTLFPLFLYLFYRNYFGVWREFSPDFSNLLNPALYQIILRSFGEQFSPLLIFFIIGIVVLLIKQEYTVLLFLGGTFVADALFHLIDEVGYVGYSRFNLFLIPAIIVGSYYLLQTLSQKRFALAAILAGAVIAINMVLTPLNWDGTKKPLWGSYLSDIAEHYYPYEDAVRWLKENHNSDTIKFTGMYYPYFFDFYFAKFDWKPNYEVDMIDIDSNEADTLNVSLAAAEAEDVDVVVYHVLGNTLPAISKMHTYIPQKVFRNQAQTLVVFVKASTQVRGN
ncbi:MAG: hypothetical protein KDJ52_03625 [Anaerolineae bacterium]|nr:hypothetical protein [Anaerolineae bacterium]